jgi:hypothetical protein
VRADAGAARGEVVADLLEYPDVPALVGEQVGGEQPAERAADDERPLYDFMPRRLRAM